MKPLAERILDALPQTQCTRCGYDDCEAYARAIAEGNADIDQCPPGGAEGVGRLSRLTGLAEQPGRGINAEFGVEGPRALAVIDEAWCIGCTLCLDACPTDAIVGIHKRMHTVIEAHCTGCELCIPVCPVDCISLETATSGRSGWQAWSQPQADQARARYAIHASREQTRPPQDDPSGEGSAERKRSIVEAALARARTAAGPRRPDR